MKKAAYALTMCAALVAAQSAVAQERDADPSGPHHGDGEACSCGAMAPSAPASEPSAASPQRGASSSAVTLTSGLLVPTPLTPVHREPETMTARETIRPNRPVLYTGLGTLAGAYVGTAALTAGRVFVHPDRTMYIPVAGPWLHLKDIREGARDTALIVGSGVAQAAGLGLTIASFFLPEKIPAATLTAAGVELSVTPTAFGAGSAGLGAVGQF